MREKGIIIAIDGPAGVGKSTTAKELAKKLGYIFIDTGAMYRALTLKAIKKNIDLSNEKNEDKVIELLNDIEIKFLADKDINKVFLDGIEVTEDIRNAEVTKNVSFVAKIGKVREYMVNLQRELGKKGGAVLEGRDIGTVVFPDAELKIFLTASIKERAKRRYLELITSGKNTTLEEVEEDIKIRDYKDSNREHSPLRKAEDAIFLDNSNMTLEEQINYIYNLALEKIKFNK